MSIIDWFQSLGAPEPAGKRDSETVRRIVGELDKLDPRQARYLATFAYVLSRVAHADFSISDVETARMIEILQSVGHLPEAQAVVVVEIAKSQARLFGGTEDFLVTREFMEIATDEQRRELLECLFAVSASDHAITAEEEAQISQTASELGFSHADYVQVRLAYSDKRTVLRRK